jgi:hypothetical protein
MRRPRKPPRSRRLWLVLGVALAVGVAARRPAGAAPPTSAPRLLYVRVADGTEVIVPGDDDDARVGASRLVTDAELRIPRWRNAAVAPGGRLVDEVLLRLGDDFAPFNVLVVPFRPAKGDYTMVLLGGTPEAFGLPTGLDGLSIVDCGDRNANNVIFIFDKPSLTPALAALAIAHEAGHTFGLDHSASRGDIMFPVVEDLARTFEDASAATVGPLCGAATLNTFALLTENVGLWPSGTDKPLFLADGQLAPPPGAGGCAVSGGARTPTNGWWALALAAAIAANRARPKRLG